MAGFTRQGRVDPLPALAVLKHKLTAELLTQVLRFCPNWTDAATIWSSRRR
jgi:hypothetical protein